MLPHEKVYFFLLVILLAACNSRQQDTNTLRQPTLTATGTYTSTATNTMPAPTETLDWLELFRDAYRPLEFTQDEILEYTELIKQALINHSPEDIAPLIHYPIHLCGLCGGSRIENEEEFIEAYDDLIDDYRVSSVLNQPYDDLIIKDFGASIGLGRGDIWLQKLCITKECDVVSEPYIVKFMIYCHLSNNYDPDDRTKNIWLEDGVFMDGSTFDYGTYVVTQIKSVGGSMLTEERFKEFESITLLPDFVDTSSSGGFLIVPCEKPQLEFCGPVYRKGQPGGINLIGELNIVCNEKSLRSFDVLSGEGLGFYYDGKYFILERIKEGE